MVRVFDMSRQFSKKSITLLFDFRFVQSRAMAQILPFSSVLHVVLLVLSLHGPHAIDLVACGAWPATFVTDGLLDAVDAASGQRSPSKPGNSLKEAIN